MLVKWWVHVLIFHLLLSYVIHLTASYWRIRTLTLSLSITEQNGNFGVWCLSIAGSFPPPYVYCYRLMNYMSQLPLIQLYFGLRSGANNHLTNKQKRFQCYCYYTPLVHKTLGAGIRRRVCPYVDADIVFNFPNPEGEDRVGFCNWSWKLISVVALCVSEVIV